MCRFVLAAGVIGCAYTLLQLPFTMYHVCKEKRMIRNGCLPEFDFYGDKVDMQKFIFSQKLENFLLHRILYES